MKRIVVLSALFFMVRASVFATYVLPYPSYMPGNKVYKISRMIDEIKKYWYWGEIGQAKYHQSLSDKYLVEAKTLFEYGQYPLALDALRRSDEHFPKDAVPEIRNAHRAVLINLGSDIPGTFVWQDENVAAVTLDIEGALRSAIAIRNE